MQLVQFLCASAIFNPNLIKSKEMSRWQCEANQSALSLRRRRNGISSAFLKSRRASGVPRRRRRVRGNIWMTPRASRHRISEAANPISMGLLGKSLAAWLPHSPAFHGRNVVIVCFHVGFPSQRSQPPGSHAASRAPFLFCH